MLTFPDIPRVKGNQNTLEKLSVASLLTLKRGVVLKLKTYKSYMTSFL
jgi:hypothetical protein